MKDNSKADYKLLENEKPKYCNFECCQLITTILTFMFG